MKTPKFIKPGDTISLTAPSFGAGVEPYITRTEAAIRNLKERGYGITVMPSTYKNDGFGISTNPKDAAQDLMEAYLDPITKAVISVGGGELMCETMSQVDFDKIKEAPAKWFMGFSDNTNFIHPLVTLCDVPAIYGPCVSSFGKPWEQSEMDAIALLEGEKLKVEGYDRFESPWEEEEAPEEEDPLAPYNLNADKVLTSFVPCETKGEEVVNGADGLRKADDEEEIKMQGTLLGGCLDILELISGTRFDGTKSFIQNHEKIIWVLEACDLNPMSIRRAVWHLKELGWFETAAGFLIGRPLASFGQNFMGVNQYNAVTGILGELGVPIIMDADIGHVKPTMPLIMGSHAEVTVRGNALSVDMNLISEQ